MQPTQSADEIEVEFDGVSHSGPGEVPGLVAAEVDAFLEK